MAIQHNSARPLLPIGVVWHTQVAVLLVGHMVSVYLMHKVAMHTFNTWRRVMVSQMPLLLLMLSYTMLGLWILSLPLKLN